MARPVSVVNTCRASQTSAWTSSTYAAVQWVDLHIKRDWFQRCTQATMMSREHSFKMNQYQNKAIFSFARVHWQSVSQQQPCATDSSALPFDDNLVMCFYHLCLKILTALGSLSLTCLILKTQLKKTATKTWDALEMIANVKSVDNRSQFLLLCLGKAFLFRQVAS